MKKNLLHREAAEQIIKRINKLTPGQQPIWGSMTATEMLLHCNKVHLHLLSPSTGVYKKTTTKQLLIRWVVLYLLPTFPRNVQAPKLALTKGTIDDTEFEQQKQGFIELVQRLSTHQEPITHRHPYFGNLNTKQWGLAGYKHVDHHLRQFGI
jgi:hypothetical protein